MMSMSVFAMKIKSAMSVLALFKNARMYARNRTRTMTRTRCRTKT